VTVITQPVADNSTFGNIDQIATTHVHLNLTANFDTSSLEGWAYHTMMVYEEGVTQIQFDIWDLTIEEVKVDYYTASYSIQTPNPEIGQVLIVILPITVHGGEEVAVSIKYSTSPTGQAFSWLTPAQTAGGQLPYMFTQCEDINCRSVAPLQDTPAIRITYSAYVYAPSSLVVKMSANDTATTVFGDQTRFDFECTIPIPCYLIAMAIGDLEYKSLGERVGVITEPSQMDAVAWELEEMGTILDAVEAYAGPYIWGTYTIIVLPPSFPMGGMENPLLTFASPTIITGDRSQVYVATHEMAHSWTGNQVTCQNWENFWLNEGWTVFIERKVSSTLHDLDFAKTEALLGNSSLYDDMVDNGLTDTFSSIHPVLQGRNPDSSFSEVPYEKGFQFLNYLETLVGEDNFKQFLRTYISQNSLTSITSLDFRYSWEYFVEREMGLDPEGVNNILGQVDFEEWVNVASLAPVTPDFNTPESDESAQMALDFIACGADTSCFPANYEDYKTYYSNLKVVFHITLLANFDQLTLPILENIDAKLDCTGDRDPEVKQRWYHIGLQLTYSPVYDPAHEWISSMGRSKYLNPVYQALQDSGQHDLAV